MYLYDKRCNWVKCHVSLSGDGVRADGGRASLSHTARPVLIFTSGASGSAPAEPVPWRFTRTADPRSGRTLAPRSPRQSRAASAGACAGPSGTHSPRSRSEQ
nr:hypothetical protein StreXyl84_53950 [Streptomyces sp. Xyl84]